MNAQTIYMEVAASSPRVQNGARRVAGGKSVQLQLQWSPQLLYCSPVGLACTLQLVARELAANQDASSYTTTQHLYMIKVRNDHSSSCPSEATVKPADPGRVTARRVTVTGVWVSFCCQGLIQPLVTAAGHRRAQSQQSQRLVT